MKVIDVFSFFNEFDILDIRLQELKDIVDIHVAVECPYTHVMKEKPLYLKNNEKKMSDKLMSLSVPAALIENLANTKDIHNIEKCQRNYPAIFLCECAEPDDIIIFSDIDEIPSKKQVKCFIESNLSECAFATRLYRYYLNLYFQPWTCCHMFRWYQMQDRYIMNFDDIRRKHRTSFHILRNNPGWHFSSIGNIDQVWEKVTAFAHAREHQRKKLLNKERIEARMKQRMHPFKDGKTQGKIHPIKNMPKYVQINYDTFKHLLLEA